MGSYMRHFPTLYHGTDGESAASIRENGFRISDTPDLWCGPGVYFYDIKTKAWWYANNVCMRIKQESGLKLQKEVISVSVPELSEESVLDFRIDKDLKRFEDSISDLIEELPSEIGIENTEDAFDYINKLRTALVSYYSAENNIKIITGYFWQRPQPDHEHIKEFASKLNIAFGIETIYCVKDTDIIKILE